MSLRDGILMPKEKEKEGRKKTAYTARIPDPTIQPCLLKVKKKT